MAALLANPRTSGSSATNGGRESRQVLVGYFACVHKRPCLLFRKDLGEAFTVQDATPESIDSMRAIFYAMRS
jgi:hypothetical protein